MNDLDSARQSIRGAMACGHFFASPGLGLQWANKAAMDAPWEVFRGQLVPSQQTRQLRALESWNLFSTQDGAISGEPLLAVMLDAEQRQAHVVRGLHCYVPEGYHAGDNVYLTREVPGWRRELIATIDLAGAGDALEQQLANWLFLAVVGLSRLPLSSVEAPLPAFSLGQLAYAYTPNPAAPAPMQTWQQWLEHHDARWPESERIKWLEFLLRATPRADVEAMADACAALWLRLATGPGRARMLLQGVFNEVALSPYTDFVEKVMRFARRLEESAFFEPVDRVDFLAQLLRQLGRHLTAYDLVTFHHRGANYPDAILLDAALKDYLHAIERHGPLFQGDESAARLRRRALRQAWILRRRYEGHLVPDAPTSPGENGRILPEPYRRVPEEQIQNPHRRSRRLYDGDPMPAHVGSAAVAVLSESERDLRHPEELREMGTGVFIERPLGVLRSPGEPDPSPLLAHEAFSLTLAERALRQWYGDPFFEWKASALPAALANLAAACPRGGIRAETLPMEPPRVVSLADAVKAAADFKIVRTLPTSVRAFCAFVGMKELDRHRGWLIVYATISKERHGILIADEAGKTVWELEIA
jgi:hypothetical protein